MSETLLITLTFYMSVIFADRDSCAYSAMGAIATPLDSCSVYSMRDTTSMSYSSDYTYDAKNNKLQWNYYEDLNCQKQYKSYEMDDVMMGIHHLKIQTQGSGDNCDTVDITVKGSFSELMDQCDPTITTNDYYSRKYVINECIPSDAEGYSSILQCNNNEIYFDYYSQCMDCSSCKPERFSFEYYADNVNCYEVKCNAPSNDIFSHSVISHKTDAQFIKTLITKEPNTPIFVPKKQHVAMVINGKIGQKPNNMLWFSHDMSFWIYTMAASFVLIVLCGICRYINSFKKEYSQI